VSILVSNAQGGLREFCERRTPTGWLGAARVSGLAAPYCLYRSKCCDTPEKAALLSPSLFRFDFNGSWVQHLRVNYEGVDTLRTQPVRVHAL
jgi:hypothetical protein